MITMDGATFCFRYHHRCGSWFLLGQYPEDDAFISFTTIQDKSKFSVYCFYLFRVLEQHIQTKKLPTENAL